MMKRKFFSWLLVLCMIIGSVLPAYAAETEEAFDAWPAELTASGLPVYTVKVFVSPEDNYTFKINVKGEGADKAAFSWAMDGKAIEGAEGSEYTLENITKTSTVMCTITNGLGAKVYVMYLVTVDNDLWATVKGSTEYNVDIYTEPGETVLMEVEAGCTKGDLTYAWYQWIMDERIGRNNYVKLDGETEPSLLSVPVEKQEGYTCEVKDQYGNTRSVFFKLDKNYKFVAAIRSFTERGGGAVETRVFTDYKGRLKIVGAEVSTGNASIEVALKDVKSLGIEGERTYYRDFEFDSDKIIPVETIANIFKPVKGTEITAVCGEDRVVYRVEALREEPVEEGAVYDAIPDSTDNARAVWQAVLNAGKVEAGTKEKEDAYAVLKNGSSVLIGNSCLEFESDKDLVIDDVGDFKALEKAFRDALVLKQTEEKSEDLIINLAPGTELALGQSFVKLGDGLKITVSGQCIDPAALEKMLTDIRDAAFETAEDYMKAAFHMVESLIQMVGGEAFTVTFETVHTYSEPEYTWTETEDGYDVTAKVVCENCEEEITETVKAELEVTLEPTCTEKGAGIYTATFTNELFEEQTKEVELPASGHDWNLEKAQWFWAKDKSLAVVVINCKTDPSHKETEIAEIEEEETPATCEEAGKIVYTATATLSDGTKVTDVKEVELLALGHAYGEPEWTWSEDFTEATATFTCANDQTEDHSHTVIVKAEIDKESTQSTFEEAGKVVYTAIVTGPDKKTYTDTKTSEIAQKEIRRILGETYYERSFITANRLKEELGVKSFDSIVVARGTGETGFADALGGSYLAAKKNAPILLIAGSEDADEAEVRKLVEAYIESNLSENGTVYILGGESAISGDFEKELEEKKITTHRFNGTNRWYTNIQILDYVGVEAEEEVLVVNGMVFADSLSAAATGRPIFLINGTSDTLRKEQTEYLEKLKAKGVTFTVLGGEAAVTAKKYKLVGNYGAVRRIAGGDRYLTSMEVGKEYFDNAEKLVIVNGNNTNGYTDGLMGGALAAALKAPILLTRANEKTTDYLNSLYVRKLSLNQVYVLGKETVKGADGKETKILPKETVLQILGIKDGKFTEYDRY